MRRSQGFGPHRIAWALGLARSTVYAVLKRFGLNRLDQLHRVSRRGNDNSMWERQANWCVGRRCKSSAAKEQVTPRRSASRARVIVRWAVKRR